MTQAIVALATIVVVLLIARERDAKRLAQLLADQARERRSLSDRIQHPEARQVEPGPLVEHEPPRDAAELAWVGAEVPEFIQVGNEE